MLPRCKVAVMHKQFILFLLVLFLSCLPTQGADFDLEAILGAEKAAQNPQSIKLDGAVRGADRQIEKFDAQNQRTREIIGNALSASAASSSGGGGESWCYGINGKDLKNACIAKFKGEGFCYSIDNQDLKNSCIAQFRGEGFCYSINDKDEKNACIAQFRGEGFCYSIDNQDLKNSCIAQFRGESFCYSINDKDEKNACIAQNKGK